MDDKTTKLILREIQKYSDRLKDNKEEYEELDVFDENESNAIIKFFKKEDLFNGKPGRPDGKEY